MRLPIVIFLVVPLFAQGSGPAATAGCTLSGHVVNSVTGAPLRSARVSLERDPVNPALSTSSASTTDEPLETGTSADGAFSFANIAPGQYRLLGYRGGFEPRYWRAKGGSDHGQPVRLEAGEKRQDIAIQLPPLCVVTGKVLDEAGDAMPGVRVEMLVPVYSSAGRGFQSLVSTETNDLGEYRVHGLTARKYFMRATPPTTRLGPHRRSVPETFLKSYYPGSMDPTGAAPVELTPGQQLNGVDFTLHRGHLVVVSGRLIMPPGAIRPVITYGHRDANGDSLGMVDPQDAAGHFTLRGLDAGEYSIGARFTADQEYNINMPLTVGSSDIENLELRPAPPVEVTGHVSFTGPSSEKLVSARLSLSAKLALTRAVSSVQKDGSIAFRGLPPDFYRIALENTAEAFVKEAHWGSVNALESGFDLSTGLSASDVSIVVSTAVATLEGIVQNDKQEPLSGAFVALRRATTSNPSADFSFQSTKSGPDGRFRLIGLAPGSYYLLAWEELDENSARYDPDRVREFATSGQVIEIAESEHKSVPITAIPKPEDSH